MEWREAIGQPFPEAWRAVLEREIGFYRQFDPATRARFEEKVKLFVLTTEFAGRDGMVVDDTVKLVVAATACRLSVNLPGEATAACASSPSGLVRSTPRTKE